MYAKAPNKVVLFAAQKARGWDSLHAASLCSGCPKPRRYENRMNRAFAIAFLFFSVVAQASPPISEQEITPKNVRELGFFVSIEVTPEATSINLVGPKSLDENCFPARSGSALMDKSGNELMVYQTNLEASDSAPVSLGYFTKMDTTMSVWLDYFCSPGQESKSRRFVIPSVAKYLITSQSTSRLSAPDSLRFASAAGY
ncbi:MAG: hypothetical protein M0Q95_11260 [Porticoccaceae bacterium]|nr:hypothetical protein [Porticoccaceae bacterium]